jgi:hypothetical protein
MTLLDADAAPSTTVNPDVWMHIAAARRADPEQPPSVRATTPKIADARVSYRRV